MALPPRYKRGSRRRGHLSISIFAGLLILAAGAFVALFANSDRPQQMGYVQTSKQLQATTLSLQEQDGNLQLSEATTKSKSRVNLPIVLTSSTVPDVKSKPASTNLDRKIKIVPKVGVPGANQQPQNQQQSQTEHPSSAQHLVLDVSYPGAVTVGDSIPITITISSETLPKVRNGNIELTLESGSLDWGSGGKRTVVEGTALPRDVNFSAGTKATGTSSIIIIATAPDPLVFSTAAGPAESTGQKPDRAAAKAKISGSVLGGASGPLSAEAAIAGSKQAAEQLQLDTRINVTVLTKYALPDSWVHWIGIGGWVVSALGAGTVLTSIAQFFRNRRKQFLPDPLP